jgi:hypothetical protein
VLPNPLVLLRPAVSPGWQLSDVAQARHSVWLSVLEN